MEGSYSGSCGLAFFLNIYFYIFFALFFLVVCVMCYVFFAEGSCVGLGERSVVVCVCSRRRPRPRQLGSIISQTGGEQEKTTQFKSQRTSLMPELPCWASVSR